MSDADIEKKASSAFEKYKGIAEGRRFNVYHWLRNLIVIAKDRITKLVCFRALVRLLKSWGLTPKTAAEQFGVPATA